MRAAIMIAGLALLAACGAKEDDIACCAIEPKAKCDKELMGLGVTPAEMAVIRSGDRVCPSMDLPAKRIRELDARWPVACREAGAVSPAYAMSSGQCRPLTSEAPPEAAVPPSDNPANTALPQ